MFGDMLVLSSLVLIGSEQTTWIFPIAVAVGFFHSAALMIPWTIIPDVVEYGELTSGQRREGLLYGGRSFAYKLASTLAVSIAGVELEKVGYIPNTPQTEQSMLGILLLLTLAPVALMVLSIVMSRAYLLTAAKHSELR